MVILSFGHECLSITRLSGLLLRNLFAMDNEYQSSFDLCRLFNVAFNIGCDTKVVGMKNKEIYEFNSEFIDASF